MLYNSGKIFLLIFAILSTASAQIAGTAGTFSRMGYGARGMGMGNALSAITSGELPAYYNPASIQFAKEKNATISYGILSLDRHHNILFYTQPIDTNAGFSIGVLNSGVSKIDGRDIDGFHTENYSTSENQFSFAFALRLRKLSIGINSKVYYYSLFEKLSSINFGVDVGVIYPLAERLKLGVVVKDMLSKYKWDTSKLYDELGNSTSEKFPLLRIIGISYSTPNNAFLFSTEIQASNQRSTIIRAGAEFYAMENFTLRAGIDGFDITDSKKIQPTFGFSTKLNGYSFVPSFNYAFVTEPYGYFTMHVISVSVTL